jgi:tetrapyrrole methylase family protein/MazG family protein
MDFSFKETYNINDLVGIVAMLRSPDGCPWDKIQTHKTIRNDMIEECYEAVEAIDTEDKALLREELGDVLLQVVFHAGIETDAGSFTFDDVANDICQKLINRHPHVFGNVSAETPDEVLKNWDAIKKTEKHQETATDTLKAVSKALPALMRGEKIIKRAYRAGYARTPEAVIAQIAEQTTELKESINSDNFSNKMGNILLNLCELSFQTKKNAEEVLTDASERFIMDFGKNISN